MYASKNKMLLSNYNAPITNSISAPRVWFVVEHHSRKRHRSKHADIPYVFPVLLHSFLARGRRLHKAEAKATNRITHVLTFSPKSQPDGSLYDCGPWEPNRLGILLRQVDVARSPRTADAEDSMIKTQ